ncbi:hypothetical protein [Actinokineospora pegani]|uniref:hypothetical protein n=1 Tax=Actinokineospora pegani TaxID=2654637 RepID=UPI0012E9DFA9|nr:hypothetical protein [Actinokineospora pegani]
MGKKGKSAKKAARRADTPAEAVKLLMKAGKVKQKCCRSKPRCKKCPLVALKRAKSGFAKAA